MNVLKNRLYSLLQALAIDPRRTWNSFCGIGYYLRTRNDFMRQQRDAPHSEFRLAGASPCLSDRNDSCGNMQSPYFLQDILVASRIYKRNPQRHIDVGSRMDGFIAHVACFRKIEVVDIRENPFDIPNVSFLQADFMKPLPSMLVESCESVSCLHALEHFGLGRYGDTVDVEGHVKGLGNLTAILKKGGILYLSVPIGPQRIEFNSQRVFSMEYLMSLLNPHFEIECFSYIDDVFCLHENSSLTPESIRTNFGCHTGCGIFELVKN